MDELDEAEAKVSRDLEVWRLEIEYWAAYKVWKEAAKGQREAVDMGERISKNDSQDPMLRYWEGRNDVLKMLVLQQQQLMKNLTEECTRLTGRGMAT